MSNALDTSTGAFTDQIAPPMGGFAQPDYKIDYQTIFVAGVTEFSQGRCSYLLDDEGRRIWLPNSLSCFISRIRITTETHANYGESQKLRIEVTDSQNGTGYSYRMGLSSWTATSLLLALSWCTEAERLDELQITLRPSNRTTFASISKRSVNNEWLQIRIPSNQLGVKLSATDAEALVQKLQALPEFEGEHSDQSEEPAPPVETAAKPKRKARAKAAV